MPECRDPYLNQFCGSFTGKQSSKKENKVIWGHDISKALIRKICAWHRHHEPKHPLLFFSRNVIIITIFSHLRRGWKLKVTNEFMWKKCAAMLSLTGVWKQQYSCVRYGWQRASDSTLFSVMVHSTSSSCKMMSFFNTLTAKTRSLPFSLASITWRVTQT